MERRPKFGVPLNGAGKPDEKGRILFETHQPFCKQLKGRRLTTALRWLQDENVFTIIDEIHRATGLRKYFAGLYYDGQGAQGPRWLRLRPGPRSARLRWMLLSATPYNPVRLEGLNQESPLSDKTADTSMDKEVEVIVDELRLTLGSLAILEQRFDLRNEIDRFVEEVGEGLRNPGEQAPENPLKIIPSSSTHLGPRRRPSRIIRPPAAHTDAAVEQLLHIHQCIAAAKEDDSLGTSLAARLVLGGARAKGGKLNGYEYADSTTSAVKVAQDLPGGRSPVKLVVLEKLVRKLLDREEKVVVFCVHRAVAKAVAKHLRKQLSLKSGELLDTSTTEKTKLKKRLKKFREKASPRIVVATDRLSESVDLHQRCRNLVHFELPWSPLRILQRVGRVWRIKKPERTKPPVAPRVFTVIHPGSVEEEIVWRLRRRWQYLESLGLGYMPIRIALGWRFPSVPWESW